MADGWTITGDLDDLVAQIESGEAAKGYAQVHAYNLRRLRELADAAGRVSFPLHTPQGPGEMAREADVPEPSQPFTVWLRAMLRRASLDLSRALSELRKP